ncbi:hypothetical protein [Pontixanthobacter sp. CEM42]|uniref:hypothetical protein n=1 Tax=Pontixanthobacter sp. CEM42 TaxID=2792077 RepID=UPI001ADF5E5C|nr:hypothetical protein [Pontixanthobacter sp. CEM42]
MTIQQHIYNQDPDQITANTQLIAVNGDQGTLRIAVKENLMRASGGGEPRDRGMVSLAANDNWPVRDVVKMDGLTWMVLDQPSTVPQVGDPLTIRIDGDHRERRRRLHTAVHLCLRSIYCQFAEVEVGLAEIDESAESAVIMASVDRDVVDPDIWEVDRRLRSYVLDNRAVEPVKAKSVEAAEEEYGDLLRISDRYAFKGRIRLIHIDGLDLNPCSGLHHRSSNIGPYSLRRMLAESKQIKLRLELRACWTYWYGD